MPREACEIVACEDNGTEIVRNVIGEFILEDGQLTYFSPANSGEMEGLMGTPAKIESGGVMRRIYAQDQPSVWFRRLPYTFSGSCLYARMRVK